MNEMKIAGARRRQIIYPRHNLGIYRKWRLRELVIEDGTIFNRRRVEDKKKKTRKLSDKFKTPREGEIKFCLQTHLILSNMIPRRR